MDNTSILTDGTNPQQKTIQHTPNQDVGGEIDATALVLAVAGMVLLAKLTSFLTPLKLYFSFSSFLVGQEGDVRWEALLVKLAIPLLVGFLLFVISFQIIERLPPSAAQRRFAVLLAQRVDATARLAGFSGSVLMAWPFIVHWDILMIPTMYELKYSFLLVYLLYFMAFGYAAGLGVDLARLMLRDRLPKKLRGAETARDEWLMSFATAIAGAITTGLATLIASRLGLAS